jgi:hypothetical protein
MENGDTKNEAASHTEAARGERRDDGFIGVPFLSWAIINTFISVWKWEKVQFRVIGRNCEF